MIIVPAYARILTHAIPHIRLIEYMARKSHQSEGQQTPDSWERFLQAVVVKKGDWSVTRHVVISVEACVSVGVATEWRTHKSGQYTSSDVDAEFWCDNDPTIHDETDEQHHGFTQSSTRFVRYTPENQLQVIKPIEFADVPTLTNGSIHYESNCFASNDFTNERVRQMYAAYSQWAGQQEDAERRYNSIIDAGFPPQVAREVLTRSTVAYIGVTYTINQWRYFFIMRTSTQTHPHFRAVTIPLLEEFKQLPQYGMFFQDIIPGKSQSENIRLPW